MILVMTNHLVKDGTLQSLSSLAMNYIQEAKEKIKTLWPNDGLLGD
jgi:hypothetical protein